MHITNISEVTPGDVAHEETATPAESAADDLRREIAGERDSVAKGRAIRQTAARWGVSIVDLLDEYHADDREAA